MNICAYTCMWLYNSIKNVAKESYGGRQILKDIKTEKKGRERKIFLDVHYELKSLVIIRSKVSSQGSYFRVF